MLEQPSDTKFAHLYCSPLGVTPNLIELSRYSVTNAVYRLRLEKHPPAGRIYSIVGTQLPHPTTIRHRLSSLLVAVRMLLVVRCVS